MSQLNHLNSNHPHNRSLMRHDPTYLRLVIQHTQVNDLIDALSHQPHPTTVDDELRRLKRLRLALADRLAAAERLAQMRA